MKSSVDTVTTLEEAWRALDEDQNRRLARCVRQQAERYEMWMEVGDEITDVPICGRPTPVDPATRGYLHHASWQIRRALERLPAIVSENSAAAEILELGPAEREWYRRYAHEGDEPDVRFCRIDAVFRAGGAARPAHLEFIEPNVVGLGGTCYAVDTVDILRECVFSELFDDPDRLQLERADDPRELLRRELLDYSRDRGFGAEPAVALIGSRNGYETDGEDRRLVDWLRQRGLDAHFADPRELELGGDDELLVEEEPVDFLFRMMELSDLTEIEQKGHRLEAMREAFDRGVVVPSLAAEFEHKSVFELFTSPDFADCFTPSQRTVFGRHVVWTRLLDARETLGPDGQQIDLPDYARRHRSDLVIKPNRSYGGSGVLIGKHVDQRDWEAAIDAALSQSGQMVVQRLARFVRERLPVPAGETYTTRPVYTVIGVFPSRHGVGLLGRYSDDSVVNVTRAGGVVPVMVDFS